MRVLIGCKPIKCRREKHASMASLDVGCAVHHSNTSRYNGHSMIDMERCEKAPLRSFITPVAQLIAYAFNYELANYQLNEHIACTHIIIIYACNARATLITRAVS